MNTKFLILLAFFVHQGYGKLTKTECYDEERCNNQTNCMNIETQISCPRICGVCNATCKDYKAFCFFRPDRCSLNDYDTWCDKTCKKCDVCEDLIKTEHCNQFKSRCGEDLVRFSCKKTCGICNSTGELF